MNASTAAAAPDASRWLATLADVHAALAMRPRVRAWRILPGSTAVVGGIWALLRFQDAEELSAHGHHRIVSPVDHPWWAYLLVVALIAVGALVAYVTTRAYLRQAAGDRVRRALELAPDTITSLRYASRPHKGVLVEMIVVGAPNGELAIPSDAWRELLVALAEGCPNAVVTVPADCAR